MGLSRALLGGVATGFLKANNDRRDRMNTRMQELADNTAVQARERAKTALSVNQKNAQAENDKIKALTSEGAIDDKGMYNDSWWLRQSQADWKEFGEPSGVSHMDYTNNTYKKDRPKGIQREYKSSADINKGYEELQSSISANLRNDLNKNAATSLDRFLGSSLRKLTGTPEEVETEAEALPQFNPMAPQSAPMGSYESEGDGALPESKPRTTYTTFDDAYDSETGEVVGNAFVATAPDGTMTNVRQLADGTYVKANLTSIKPIAAEIKLNVPKDNRAAFETAYATVADTISATGKINQSLNVYSEKSQGSQGFIVDVVSGIAALTTIWQGSGNANEEKIKVQKAYDVIREATDISAEEKVFLLNPDNKNVIIGRGKTADVNERERLISSMKLVLDEEALEEGQEYLTVAVRNSTIDTLAISAAWDMARANRQGDGSKISLREVESYIDLLGASSNEQDFVTKINVLKEDLVKKSLNSLHNMFRNTKFGGTESTFSTANGTVSHLLDPKSGDVALIQKGTIRKEGRSINMMYIMTGREGSIIEINLDDGTSDDLIKLDQWDKIESNFSSPVYRSGRAK
jgi:hypothetical protein